MGLYWKGGTVQLTHLQAGQGGLRFAQWAGFSRLVWEDIMGGVEAILGLCGAKNTRCRLARLPEDAETLEFELRWS